MSTALATISASDERALAAMLGMATEEKAFMPQLKINLDDEDAEGNPLKKGKFFVTGQEIPVYADKVRIRPLSQMFQWVEYDPDQNKSVNRTLIIPNFRAEPRDEKGGVRCGKPASKVLKDNPELAKKFKNITCFRLVHCLVSYEGESSTGDKIKVENQPALLRLKGANFSPFEDEVVKALPKGTKLYDFWIEVSATKKKNGSVTYFVLGFNPELGKPVPLDQMTYDTMLHIVGTIKEENDRIEAKYRAAVGGRTADDAALNAIEVLDSDSLDDDLVDE